MTDQRSKCCTQRYCAKQAPKASRLLSIAAMIAFGALGCSTGPQSSGASQVDAQGQAQRTDTSVPAVYQSRIVGLSWWLTEALAPRDTVLLGIPARSIVPTWRVASILAAENLSEEARQDLLARPPGGPAFRITGDFNRNTEQDVVAVGVYRSDDGVDGNFVLILESRGNVQSVDTVLVTRGRPTFSALTALSDSSFAIWNCLDCGDFVRVVFSRGAYRFAPVDSSEH